MRDRGRLQGREDEFDAGGDAAAGCIDLHVIAIQE